MWTFPPTRWPPFSQPAFCPFPPSCLPPSQPPLPPFVPISPDFVLWIMVLASSPNILCSSLSLPLSVYSGLPWLPPSHTHQSYRRPLYPLPHTFLPPVPCTAMDSQLRIDWLALVSPAITFSSYSFLLSVTVPPCGALSVLVVSVTSSHLGALSQIVPSLFALATTALGS